MDVPEAVTSVVGVSGIYRTVTCHWMFNVCWRRIHNKKPKRLTEWTEWNLGCSKDDLPSTGRHAPYHLDVLEHDKTTKLDNQFLSPPLMSTRLYMSPSVTFPQPGVVSWHTTPSQFAVSAWDSTRAVICGKSGLNGGNSRFWIFYRKLQRAMGDMGDKLCVSFQAPERQLYRDTPEEREKKKNGRGSSKIHDVICS